MEVLWLFPFGDHGKLVLSFTDRKQLECFVLIYNYLFYWPYLFSLCYSNKKEEKIPKIITEKKYGKK